MLWNVFPSIQELQKIPELCWDPKRCFESLSNPKKASSLWVIKNVWTSIWPSAIWILGNLFINPQNWFHWIPFHPCFCGVMGPYPENSATKKDLNVSAILGPDSVTKLAASFWTFGVTSSEIAINCPDLNDCIKILRFHEIILQNPDFFQKKVGIFDRKIPRTKCSKRMQLVNGISCMLPK